MAMFSYEFMQRAFWAGGLIGIIGPLLGVYLMLRRQVLMADTLSHVSLAGVALGSILQLNPALSGFMVAILGGIVIEQLRRSYRTYSELPVAIIMTSGLALAVVLMSLKQNLSKSFSSYLFGSIVAVSDTQLKIIAAVAVIGLVYFIVLRRSLYNLTFDEETASISGVHVGWLSFSFAVLTGMTVAAAMPVVGVLLVSALIVLPASIALRIASGFTTAILISIGVGLLGVFSGLSASYYINTPPGGTIALILLSFLLIAILVQKLIRLRNRRRIHKSISRKGVTTLNEI
ncbi:MULTISPECIES: metal ABC transporter permease [Paenibacillus]|uniref:Zinc ABC transporter permease n=1 Tax=Paenibacillus odorifer TaxID=189426 RepID=A0A1R0XB88_9BACL|nr:MULTISPECIES: metal ABC transporter permease [Paenibacillus]AIQ73566.1 zinc ABC transporter permease [Paenibacillus odorifer]OMD32187.1 zinc ABC transporter permease [Paenibacillus odorifer]OME43490.1 zinc ABC transporter permease [Paenibacillus odorifer]OME56128.1 zinc ABC transporter permease [Paenibacillus odorifer]OME61173.1 zinc ABC transporter permease [Paenibacillus odorifer]